MRGFKVVKVCLMVVAAIVVFGFVTMHLWNWLVPAIFGLRAITFVESLGLLLLSKILFGGFHRHGPGGGRHWRQKMEAKWEAMTPEEREKLRAGMMGHRCGWGRREEPVAAVEK